MPKVVNSEKNIFLDLIIEDNKKTRIKLSKSNESNINILNEIKLSDSAHKQKELLKKSIQTISQSVKLIKESDLVLNSKSKGDLWEWELDNSKLPQYLFKILSSKQDLQSLGKELLQDIKVFNIGPQIKVIPALNIININEIRQIASNMTKKI